ncbi:hypothetical protein N0V92_002346 [Colletotrichum tropicale]|nr:hypothetical protein N0V92_002346 [Colletotrichum tropicale]
MAYIAACHSNGLFGRQNCVKITGQLLERGADVNAAGGKFGNALQAAASSACGLDEAVESLLLSKGAEVNKQGGLYGTALQGACVGGRVGVVRLLLAHGSEVNVECGEYGTALQAACALEDTHSGYDFESIQPADCGLPHLLIEHGADVHIQGGVFGSAWHAAATQFGRSKPNNDTLLMLLNHGIDVNDHKGRLHGTALQAALELLNDPSKLMPRIRFLLENGANINVEAGKYGFPLQSACMSPESSEGLTYLLENCPDIDVNMTGGLYGTALQAAVYTGKTNGVKLLLEKGADVNARGGKYRSALNAAVNEGHWDLVEILLTAGAKPDCHQLPQLDEEWLGVIEKEDGRGAVERHRNFWKKQKLILNEDKAKETDNQ